MAPKRRRGRGQIEVPQESPATPVNEGQTQMEPVLDAIGNLVGALQNQTNWVEVTAQATPTVGSGSRREVTETEDKHVLMDFKKLHSVAFKGTDADPAVSTQWISDLEKVYEVIRCTNAQKVMCATFMLQGEADQWWKMTKPILEAGDRQITQDEFKVAFDHKFFPPCVKQKKIFEFMHLTQGSQTVMMYERKFEELSRYAPQMVSTEEMKAQQSEQGLRVEIQKSISPMQLKTYAEVVHKSQIYEAVEKNATKDEEVEPKKKFKKSFATHTANKDNWKKFHKKKPQGNVDCKKCGKNHKGDCLGGTFICFKCKEPGHLARNCPTLKEQPERNPQGGQANQNSQNRKDTQGN
ncbi:uncharacterized protein LOC122647759 [Telopea speciosissima]|uniref:uncharacterized protein LOC122647759 n=1 Tax=Telopea speciosissima TaxID=54955 RepID=UPI001CC64A2B|nr:uncharacterized protein LOC122647759 [Telopea speciosissima]